MLPACFLVVFACRVCIFEKLDRVMNRNSTETGGPLHGPVIVSFLGVLYIFPASFFDSLRFPVILWPLICQQATYRMLVSGSSLSSLFLKQYLPLACMRSQGRSTCSSCVCVCVCVCVCPLRGV